LNAGATLSAEALITRLFEASLNGNGSLFANPLITKFAASSLNANASLAASALVSKLAASSLTGAGTLAADLTVTSSATLLLDLYPNAAAAYSLRKLRTAYTGNAIRVRRSSDNTEQDIGFTALGVLDESALTTFCGVGNGFVTTWYDQSGNARNVTQTTAANQPQIVSSGNTITLNNKITIKFNAQFLNGTPFSMNNLNLFTVLNKITQVLYAGYMRNTPSTGNGFLIYSLTNTWVSSITKFINNTDTNPDYVRTIVKSIPTNQYLENWTYNDSSKVLVENNLQIAVAANSNNWAGGSVFRFGSVTYNGNVASFIIDIQEIIFYESSDSEGVRNNINSYYAIY
jgi:hypothetical protein